MTAGASTDIENEEIPPEDGPLQEGREAEEEVEASRRCRRGLQPRDYVAGKDRLRVGCLDSVCGGHLFRMHNCGRNRLTVGRLLGQCLGRSPV